MGDAILLDAAPPDLAFGFAGDGGDAGVIGVARATGELAPILLELGIFAPVPMSGLTPDVQTLTLTTEVPTVMSEPNLTPDVQTLTLTNTEPNVAVGQLLQPDVQSLTFEALAVVVGGPRSLAIDGAQILEFGTVEAAVRPGLNQSVNVAAQSLMFVMADGGGIFIPPVTVLGVLQAAQGGVWNGAQNQEFRGHGEHALLRTPSSIPGRADELSVYFQTAQSTNIAGICNSFKTGYDPNDMLSGYSTPQAIGSRTIAVIPGGPISAIPDRTRDTPDTVYARGLTYCFHTARPGFVPVGPPTGGSVGVIMMSVATDPNLNNYDRWSDPVTVLQYTVAETWAEPFASGSPAHWNGGYKEVACDWDPGLGHIVLCGTGLTSTNPAVPTSRFRWRVFIAHEAAPFDGTAFPSPTMVFDPLEEIPEGHWGFGIGGAYQPYFVIDQDTNDYHLFITNRGRAVGHFVSTARGVAGSWVPNPDNPLLTLDLLGAKMIALGQPENVPIKIGSPFALKDKAAGKWFVGTGGGPNGQHKPHSLIYLAEALDLGPLATVVQELNMATLAVPANQLSFVSLGLATQSVAVPAESLVFSTVNQTLLGGGGAYCNMHEDVRRKAADELAGLDVAWPNAKHSPAQNQLWAEVWVRDDAPDLRVSTEAISFGGRTIRYRKNGVLRILLRQPLGLGNADLLARADLLRAAFMDAFVGGTRYGTPWLENGGRDTGDHEGQQRLDFVVGFYADDDHASDANFGTQAPVDREEAHNIARGRFARLITTAQSVTTINDGELREKPPDQRHVVFSVHTGRPIDSVGSARQVRNVGLATAMIVEKLNVGTSDALGLADEIVLRFRSVAERGVQFDTPYLRTVGRRDSRWLLLVLIPFRFEEVA